MNEKFWDAYDFPTESTAPHDGTDTLPAEMVGFFCVPESLVAECLPPNLWPHRHHLPTWSDPSAQFPDLATIFGSDLKLTQANEGIRSQKVTKNLTEIAEAICHRHKFATISGRLAVYRPPCWRLMGKEDTTNFIVRAAKQLFPGDSKYLSDRQYDEIAFQVLHANSTERLNNIPTPDYRYLACRDSMYDWHTGECLSHNSADYRFAVLDLDAASIGNCNGTYWELFLDALTGGDDALRQRTLELIGVILSGFPTKSFFLLEGESGTGKSQLVNFLRDVLGEGACLALNNLSQLGDRFTTGAIFGKLLCLCGDVPNAPLTAKAIGAIKQLTGDDLIRGEFKYRDIFTFENAAKLMFVSNYPLQIPDQEHEDALMDRLVAIPCLYPVPKEQQIAGLHKLLHEEAGYIVHLAMDALIDLEARNGIFTPLPEHLEYETVQVPCDEQLLLDFVQDCCQLGEGMTCTVDELCQAFRTYVSAPMFDGAKFSKLLCRTFPEIKRSRTGKTRGYQGIQLKE